jgi:hypothetical protein
MEKLARTLLKLFLFFLFLQEASMTQVHYQTIPHNWEHSFDNSPVIVLARRTGSLQKIREWVFPRETHVTKSEETLWQEWAQPYEILEVIRPAPGRPLGPGQEILVWQEQEYGWQDLEYYHQTGIIHSPFVLVQEAEEDIQNGRVLLFLEPSEDLWRPYNATPEAGEALLDRRGRERVFPPESLLLYFENRSRYHRDGIAWWISQEGLVGFHGIRILDGTYLEERRGIWRLLPEEWEQLSTLIRTTRWNHLEFRGALLPDETRPRLQLATPTQTGSWLVEALGESAEASAYRRLFGTLQSQAEGLRWIRTQDSFVDFGWKPWNLR